MTSTATEKWDQVLLDLTPILEGAELTSEQLIELCSYVGFVVKVYGRMSRPPRVDCERVLLAVYVTPQEYNNPTVRSAITTVATQAARHWMNEYRRKVEAYLLEMMYE